MQSESNQGVVFQLPPSLIDDLDQIKIDFRKQISGKKRNQLSRSKLCELILHTIIVNYQDNGDKSALDMIISEWLKTNG